MISFGKLETATARMAGISCRRRLDLMGTVRDFEITGIDHGRDPIVATPRGLAIPDGVSPRRKHPGGDFGSRSHWFVVDGAASPTEIALAGEGFCKFIDRGVAIAFILESRRPAKARSGDDKDLASYARKSDHEVRRHR